MSKPGTAPLKHPEKHPESADIRFKNIRGLHWLGLAAILILSAIGSWQSIKPFIAERAYRDGFHARALAEQWEKQRDKSAAKRYYLKSLHFMEKAVHFAPLETHYMTELGKAYEEYAKVMESSIEKIKYYSQAAALYQKIIRMDANNPWYQSRLAGAWQNMARLIPEKRSEYDAAAEKAARTAAEIDSKNPLFQLNFAYFLHRNNRIDDAIPFYERTIAIDERLLEARFNLADIYRQKKDEAKMIEQYQLVYEKNPDFPRVRLALAQHYIGKNNSAGALPFLEEELAADQSNKNVIINLLRIYHENKSWPKLVETYDIFFRRFPKEKKTYLNFYIQALVNASEFDRALQEVTNKVKENPADKEARNQLNVLQKVQDARKTLPVK